MDFSTIIFEKQGAIGIIRLNRPQRMNAVNETMYQEIQQVLNKAGSDDEVRVMIFIGSVYHRNGREKQAFCSGADLKEHDRGRRSKKQQRIYIELAHETTRKVYEFTKPTIAAVNGPARGAGVELALNCDFVIMAEQATMAFTETGLGTFVGGGVTFHLPAIVGLMKSKELIYTGKIIDGKGAVQAGLALKSVPIEELMVHTLQLAEVLSEKAPLSMKLAKIRLQDTGSLQIKDVLKQETEAILSCMESEDWHEGIKSFLEKRKPVFKGR